MRILLASAILCAANSSAQEVTIKLGTLSPNGSPWHASLKSVAEKWAAASDGKVKLRVYAGGTQGSEGEMVRKMAIGQLQGSSITNVGLHDISTLSMVFSTPGMFDEKSFEKVFPQVQPELEADLDAKGYVVLTWVRIGIAYIFCKDRYPTPAAAAAGKFFAWDGDPGSIAAFKSIGFRPIVLSSTDIIPSLRTGMINCIAQVPVYMLSTRIFEDAKEMIDYPWTYVLSATIVKKATWERIPADLRSKLLAIARAEGDSIDAASMKLSDDALAAMLKQGLHAVKVDPAPWKVAATKTWTALRGKVVPEQFFDKVAKLAEAANASP